MEEPFGQRHRIGTGLLASLKMEVLQSLRQSVEMVAALVHRRNGVEQQRERRLAYFNYGRCLAILQQLFNRADRRANTTRPTPRFVVTQVTANVDGFLKRPEHLCRGTAGTGTAGGVNDEPFAKPFVVLRPLPHQP